MATQEKHLLIQLLRIPLLAALMTHMDQAGHFRQVIISYFLVQMGTRKTAVRKGHLYTRCPVRDLGL
jgi:hypothetical protein